MQKSYKEFIQALHLALIGRDPIRLENLVLELIDRDSDRIKTFFMNYIEVRDTTSTATKIEKERRLKVFICHSSGDKIAVRDLYQHLKTSNVDPWLDEENLLAGQNWEYEIRQAVRATDVVLVCLS